MGISHDNTRGTSQGCSGDRRLACSGQRPASTRNRLLLPEPLGPMMMTERPGGTSNVSSLTSTVPSGAYSASLRDANSDVEKSQSSQQPFSA